MVRRRATDLTDARCIPDDRRAEGGLGGPNGISYEVDADGIVDLARWGEVRAVRVDLGDVRRRRVSVEGLIADGTWLPLTDEYPAGLSTSWSSRASGAVSKVRLTGRDADGCRLHVWFELWPDLTRDLRVTATSSHPWHPPHAVLGEQISRTWRAGEDDLSPNLTVTIPHDSAPALLELVGVGHTPRVEVSGEDGWQEIPVELAGLGPRLRCLLDDNVRRVRISRVHELCAVRVFGTPGDSAGDLTGEAQLRATSHRHGHEPRHVLNDSSDTWQPAADDLDPRLTLDLGRLCAVTSVVVESADSDARPAVEGSSDGHEWARLDQAARVRQLRLAGSGAIRSLRVRGHGCPARSAWWERGTPVMRYFPKQYAIRFDALSATLPELQRRGFRAIEIAGIKQGPPSAFAGLGATDNYAVDDRLGTVADLHHLLRRADELGLKVIGFDNLGYAHRTAPAFRAAAARVAADAEADGYPFLLARSSQGERWHSDPETGVWYFAYWGEDLPSYDWHRRQWREQSARILRHWVSQGLDGVGIDAPRDYPGADLEAERRYIGEELTAAGVWSFAEGIPASPGAGPQTAWQRVIVEQRFSAVLDLSISVWDNPVENQLVPAIGRADPAGLEALLHHGRDAVAAVGGVIMEAPGWEGDLIGEGVVPATARLLEIALLATCGSMFYLTNGLHTYRPEVEVVPTWNAVDQQCLEHILGAVGSEAPLGPAGLRLPLPTDDPRHVAWLRTDGSGVLMAVVVFSFATESTAVTIDLTGAMLSELGPDLLSGADPSATLGKDSLRLELPARGFAAFGVR